MSAYFARSNAHHRKEHTMATARQIEANRRNAQKSTSPRIEGASPVRAGTRSGTDWQPFMTCSRTKTHPSSDECA